MDYRERCYEAFISKHWSFSHDLGKRAYEFSSLRFEKRYHRFLPHDKKAMILDIACGAGKFLYFLQKTGYHNTGGIDLSKEQIDLARQIGVENVWVDDLFSYLPKVERKYNMIIANDIIEHLTKEETMEFLDKIMAALKPGGSILISTPNAFSLFGAGRVFVDFTHETGFTSTSLAQVLRVCGFKDVAIYGEEPIVIDFRSFARNLLWNVMTKLLKYYVYIEEGTGRYSTINDKFIFTSRMFAVAVK
jgi:2-polyprenyl-3-methyl-5-hydroxy-6-metoxy-1,4-benzoquinol methylase